MFINKKAAFATLGCKVNRYETEGIKNDFINAGYEIVEFEEKADIYIINTCTVTSIADRKSRNLIRRAKRISPNSIVVATGCYSQTNSTDLEKMDGLDYIIGNLEKYSILDIIRGDKRVQVGNIFENRKFDNRYTNEIENCRAYVKIQDGCDNFCSYCKIPYGRGKKRSRKIVDIVNEVKKLSKLGYREIVLIGINLSAYGEDLDEDIDLCDAIISVKDIGGIERIRLGSIYPDKIDRRLIEIILKNENVMPHLHISMQSGDSKILKLMNRKYSAEQAEEILKSIKQAIPDIGLTADFIVGFPNESGENFDNTFDFIERVGFSDIHIFKYSDRENTEATRFINKVSPELKKIRAEKMASLKNSLRQSFFKEQVKKQHKILIEEIVGNKAVGYTENYIKTYVTDYNGSVNEIIKVEVLSLN